MALEVWQHKHFADGSDQSVQAASHHAVPKAINHVKLMDFMHGQLSDGRSIWMPNVIDDFSREALGIEVDFLLPSKRVICALWQIIGWRGRPQEAICCDKGTECPSSALTEWVRHFDIGLNYIQPGNSRQNAYVKRFNWTVRYEWLSQYHWESLEHIQHFATGWLWALQW